MSFWLSLPIFYAFMGWDCLCQSNVAGLEKNLIPGYPLHKQLSYIKGGGGERHSYFGDAINKHF